MQHFWADSEYLGKINSKKKNFIWLSKFAASSFGQSIVQTSHIVWHSKKIREIFKRVFNFSGFGLFYAMFYQDFMTDNMWCGRFFQNICRVGGWPWRPRWSCIHCFYQRILVNIVIFLYWINPQSCVSRRTCPMTA